MLKFKDDAQRLRDEFASKIDFRLQFLLSNLAVHIWEQFKKDVVITCLLRTAAENAVEPGSNPVSAHLRGDGADIRSWHYSQEEIDHVVAYVKHHWGPLAHVKYHTPEEHPHPHLHININWPYTASRFTA